MEPGQGEKELKTLRKWTYDYFREYMLAVGKGLDYLLPIKEFPEEIELNHDMHSVLNKMRDATKDGKERWVPIGFREDIRGLFIPTKIAVGKPYCVPPEVIADGRERMRFFGMTEVVGDLHTHPTKSPSKKDEGALDFPIDLGLLDNTSQDIDYNVSGLFSLGDIYRLTNPSYRLKFMGVAHGNENIFAFRSQESVGKSPDESSMEDFERRWYERYGYSYSGRIEDGTRKIRKASKIVPSLQYINDVAAQTFKLAYYRGKQDGPLIKEYPTKQ